jgi:hypothetical protein
VKAADRSPSSAPPSLPARVRVHTPISIMGGQDSRNDRLIRTLALDRLRDLRDDGVTLDYIGRMYGVSGERIAAVERDLRS